VVTRDPEFRKVEGLVGIDWLGGKKEKNGKPGYLPFIRLLITGPGPGVKILAPFLVDRSYGFAVTYTRSANQKGIALFKFRLYYGRNAIRNHIFTRRGWRKKKDNDN